MGRAERPPIGQRAVVDLAGDRRNHRDFQQLGRRERRQNSSAAAPRASDNAGGNLRREQSLHSRHPCIRSKWERSEAHLASQQLRGSASSRRARYRHRLRAWTPGWPLVRDRLKPGDPRGGQNNSSRIVTVDPMTGTVTPFITGLPTGDHPSEQLAFKDNWIYWSQGSTTNSGVVGRDNGGGTSQPDIPCQDIKLSQNVFNSGGGVMTSGYSPFGMQRPGATVKAFESALHRGVCDGAILRARLNTSNPAATIEPFSWGYRNGYAIRFAPDNHPLDGGLLVGEDGPDERGARPSNNAPDNLHLAQQNKDGSPDYHGWPDRFGFLASSQAVFNPIGGPSDDLCVFDPTNPPSKCTPASLAQILARMFRSAMCSHSRRSQSRHRWRSRRPTPRSPASTSCRTPLPSVRCSAERRSIVGG